MATLSWAAYFSDLAHVFNHATHHRGQNSAALTHMGHACPELDMAYSLQQKKAPAID